MAFPGAFGDDFREMLYDKLGVRILQRAWFNFDLYWAIALIVSGFVTALPFDRSRLPLGKIERSAQRPSGGLTNSQATFAAA